MHFDPPQSSLQRPRWCALGGREGTIMACSHFPCRANAVPLPCRAALINICHAAPLPFSDSAVSFVKVRVVAGNIRTAFLQFNGLVCFL
jgi:hypothetical protein